MLMRSKHDFGRLKFLIVDDFANFCSALRGMVRSYGVDTVDIVHNGDDALRLLAKTKYDVVLCDYNLGDGRNGNDVLEETKHRKLLKSANLFLMITAENTSEMVRGALEYQPDDYLTKPFTKEVLLTRLERLLDRNILFKDVFRLHDREEMGEGIERCESLAKEHPRYRNFALKLQSEMLFESHSYEQATMLFQEVLMVRHLPWVKLGLGKSFFYQQSYDKAAKAFREMVQEDAGYVQAWDWLARCQELQGDTEAAQASLEAAVRVSPVNVKRQSHLGELALENGDNERAELALGRAIKIGKHSVYREPGTYLKLSEVLVGKLGESEGLNKKRAEQKALGAMEELRQMYKGDNEINLRSRLLDHQVHTIQGHASEADKALYRAYDICQHDDNGLLDAELKEQLISKLETQGRTDLVDGLVQAMQQEESNHNREAVGFYEQGDLVSALGVLQKAIEEKPRSYAINLNLAQVAMHYVVKEGMDQALLDQAGEALARVADIGETARGFKQYQDLSARYQKLVSRTRAKSSG